MQEKDAQEYKSRKEMHEVKYPAVVQDGAMRHPPLRQGTEDGQEKGAVSCHSIKDTDAVAYPAVVDNGQVKHPGTKGGKKREKGASPGPLQGDAG